MELFPNLKGRDVVIDTETTGLVNWRDTPIGAAVKLGKEPGAYFDFRRTPAALQWLKDQLPLARSVIGHNIKFDLHMLANVGVAAPARVWDTMVALALLDEHRRTYNLDDAAREFLGEGKVEMSKQDKENIAALPFEVVAPYAIRDVELTARLLSDFDQRLYEEDLITVMGMEMRLLPVLFEMERGGVRVDVPAAEASILTLTDRIDEMQAALGTLNPNSPKQIRELFAPEGIGSGQFRLRDGTLCGPTATGTPSIDQHVLRGMVDPVAKQILALRKAIKTRDTFLRNHILGHVDPHGYVHTTFNQTRTDAGGDFNGTGSGRLSATAPAVQQINKRDKENAAIVRSLFLPDEGQDWFCLDHSQIDFRMAVHLMADPAMLRAYAENPLLDYHQAVSDMTGIPRNPEYAGGPNTKMLNLMLAFGSSAGTAAFHMGMPCTLEQDRDGKMRYKPGPEAQAMFEQYHARLPAVRRFLAEATARARSVGYVRTPLRRRLRFPFTIVNGRRERAGAYKAGAMCFQSWAADVHKVGLIATAELLKGTASRLMISVHDEENVSMDRGDRRNGLAEEITRAYCAPGSDSDYPNPAFRLRVPIRASGAFGPNWHEASK